MESGCPHYRRGCRIVAPCCGDLFGCRHCHNDAKNALEVDPRDRHEIPRHQITKVICSFCNKEQNVQQNCSSCGACMGKYFCKICNFFDDDVSKDQYHCDGCGICRTGGADNFFHCDTCGCCYSNVLKDSHRCVERAMHHNCPVCFEYLFDSTKDISVLQCGHTIHLECMNEMRLPLLVPGVLTVGLRHDGHVAEAGRGGRGDAHSGDLPEEDGMDPLQRLQRDVERAVPRRGAQVPRLQLLQHQGDEGRPGVLLQSLMSTSRPRSQTSWRFVQSHPVSTPDSWCKVMVEDAVQ